MVTGQIVEKHPFTVTDEAGASVDTWQRILVESAPSIFVQVFAKDASAALPLGAQVNLVGRYWGVRKAPVAQVTQPESTGDAASEIQDQNQAQVEAQAQAASDIPDQVSLPTIASIKGSVIDQEAANGVVSLLGLVKAISLGQAYLI